MYKRLSKVAILTAFALSLALTSFCSIADGKKEQQLFFENPTIAKFNNLVNIASSAGVSSSDINKDKFIVFCSEAFKANPALYKEVISHFTSYDLSTQELLYSALVSSNVDLPLQFKEKHKAIKIRIAKDVATINFIEPYSTKSDLKSNMDIADLHWAAYHASGDPLFLKKILKFSANHSALVKDISYEYTNREYLRKLSAESGNSQAISDDDLIRVEKEQNITYQVMGYRTISWSIWSNAAMYKIVNKTIEQLLKEDKSLRL